ncbi:MAG: hypothetical protein ACHQVS_03470 [Candidatus Babeliales bacterium]
MKFSMKLAALTLTALVLTSSTATHAITITYRNAPKYAAGVLFAASILKYCNTTPNNDPVRYNICELASFQNILHNLKYLIIDGLIGHKKEDAKVKVDKDGYVIVDETKKAPAKGLYGNIDSYYLKPILKTLGFVAGLRSTVREINGGIADWQSFQFSDMIPTIKFQDTEVASAA